MHRFQALPWPLGRPTASAVVTLLLCFGCGGGGSATTTPPPPAPTAETWRMSGTAATANTGVMAGLTGSLIMAEVVQTPSGLYRLYFGGRRASGSGMDIWMAESTDATTWQVRGIALAGSSNAGDPDFEAAGASVLQLPDGRWRMYYQGTPQFNPTGPAGSGPHFQMLSAISTDGGATFPTKEGVRIASTFFDPTAFLNEAGHARVVQVGGAWLAFVSGSVAAHGTVSNDLYAFRSSDGVTFGAPQVILPNGHDPYVVQSGGDYLLYADTSPVTGLVAGPTETLMASPDATTWDSTRASTASFQDGSGAPLHIGGAQPAIGDIGGIVLSNGKLRLFSNYNVSNIVFYDRVSP